MTPSERPQDACGVVGVYSPGENVARSVFFGLYSLQHRGQESVGISSGDGERIRVRTAMGQVAQVFDEEDLGGLSGHVAIGHTRYSTTGTSNINNAQPIIARGPDVELALAHNGNVVNALDLREELSELGCTFSTSSDSELVALLLAHALGSSWEERVAHCMRRLRGAYSLAVMTRDTLLAIRDPMGVRPLSIGTLNGGWIVASETCALDHVGADFVREVEPGEAVLFDEGGMHSIYRREPEKIAFCIFEYIYFAGADSVIKDRLVYTARMNMGKELARVYPVDADMVIAVPDSATAAAVGYSQQSGIPFGEGLVKNRYVGRTFILPDQRLRDLGVRRKFNPLREIIQGKRIVVVEDSIVRGTTSPHVLDLLRSGGVKEVHMRICAPPIMWPCHLGIDFGTSEGAYRRQHVRRGDPPVHWSRLPGLPEPRGPLAGRWDFEKRSLHGLFHGRLPNPRPARDGQAGPGDLTLPGLGPLRRGLPRRHGDRLAQRLYVSDDPLSLFGVIIRVRIESGDHHRPSF